MRKILQIDERESGIARYRATTGASRSPAADAPVASPDESSGGDEPRFQLEAPAISLPKGGGAIKGIDEKFAVNASNGTLSLSLPLPLTPARNGAAPPLRLSYDTGAGNSVVGLGWTLELASVRRGTDRFIPRYDADDVFLLTGGDDLVPGLNWDGTKWVPDEEHPGGLTVKRYRPRVDRDFARIEQISDGGANTWWRVMSRENVTTFYGIDENSRIVDPERPSRVYEWLPAISFDDQGNCVVYAYKPDDLAGVTATQAEANRLSGLAKSANRYLKRVAYGNRTPYFVDPAHPYTPAAPAGEFMFEAVLDYGEHDPAVPTPDEAPGRAWAPRPDPFSSHRPGFEIRTRRLLQRVLMFHRFDELNAGEPTLVRSLDLAHAASDGGEVSYLASATQCGYAPVDGGGYSKRSLPALEFDYQAPAWNPTVRVPDPGSVASLPAGATTPSQWVDLYGEGIAGVFGEQEGAWRYCANLGDVDEPGKLRLDTSRLVGLKPSFAGVRSGVLTFEDLDADGRKQVVVRSPEITGYFELEGGERWAELRPLLAIVRIDLSDRHVRMLDLVGDGRADILVSEDDALVWYRSKGTNGFGERYRTTLSSDEERSPAVVFTDQTQAILLADMTGDGLTDIVRVRNRDVSYWPNRGYGRFGARVAMNDAPVLAGPGDFDARHVRLADLSGTGATDLLYLGRDGCHAYLNLSGNSLGPRREVASALRTESPVEIATADVLGNGTTCLVWSSALPADHEAPLRYVDPMGGAKPHLLRGYSNGLGKQVEFEYTSSTWHYLKDRSEGRPWATRLPFPVHCVRRVESRDTIAGSRRVCSYRYHHGHYDHREREFRGFGMVEETDAEEFEHWGLGSAGTAVDRTVHQAPVLTKTWFHTGAELDDGSLLDVYRNERWDAEMRRRGFTANADEPELPDIRTVAAAGPELGDPLPPAERREAQRACRGMPLRREVFAPDAPPAGATQDDLRRQLSPYTVGAHTCVVELLQPPLDGGHAVLTVKESERITWQYDRDIADPRVEHTLNVKVDEYGNVLESAKAAYARRNPDASLPDAAVAAQGRPLVTYTLTEMTGDAIGADHHRLRVASRVTDYELTGLPMPGPIFALADFERPGFSVLTTTTEIPNQQDNVLPAPGTVFRRMIARKETLYYDAGIAAAAAFGHVEPHGLPFESYELAFPAALLTDVFAARATDAVMAEGGYVHRGDADWWTPSGRWEYVGAGETAADARNRFLAHVAQVDALGSRATIGYFGGYFLLQDEVVDAAGNHTQATFDLRTLRPRQIRDANDNLSEVLFDELGWVKATALRGKGAEADGLGALASEASAADDAAINQLFAAPSSVEVAAAAALLLGTASARYAHDLDRYRTSGGALPPVTAVIVREQHAAVKAASPLQVSFEYPNGSGNVELTKVQAEPGPATSTAIASDGTVTLTTVDTAALVPPRLRWLGTGRKVVNNKGNVVKEYEPFFSVTWEFETEQQLVAAGVTRIHLYDPVDRLVRVDYPDGSLSRTRHGPWAVVEEDRNDTVLESRWYDERINRKIDAKLVAAGKDPVREAAAAAQAAEHANTPLARHLDPLGRPVVETHDVGADGLLHTAYRRDLSGRTLAVTNPRGILTVAYRRDMRGTLARCDSPDSGTRLTLANVLGSPLRAWDDRAHELRFTYDALHRPLTKRVLGGDGPQPLDNVFELNVYGEGRPGDKAANLRTRLALAYDTAGRTEHTGFDFKGNLLTASRRFATEYRAVVDWSGANPDTKLDAESFDSACSYDALDRITSRTVPDGSVHTPTYNAANLLETVTVTQAGGDELVVKNIDYDEHGMRQRIVLGNEVETDYLHDAETFRLVRLTTSRGGTALQDLAHTYDPVGNLTHLVDACVPTVWFANAMVTGESTFRYDPIYRLVEATGREHAGQIAFGATDNSSDAGNLASYAVTDLLAWQTYTEHYHYDPAGNLQQIAHTAPATPGWTRDYTYPPDSDRLLKTTIGAQTYTYGYHPKHGYVESMPHLSLMRWSFKDELQAVATQVVGAGVPETTWHVYDGDGKRVRKVTDRAAPTQDAATRRFERYTVDGTEIEREYDAAGTLTAQRRSLHVMDDQERIALIETDDPPGGPPGPRLIRYQGPDRLGSAALETDAGGRVISYEVFHPFGTTAYQAVDKTIVAAAKRFRYIGMERDAESGLEYHGARYYAPWLGRWLAADTHPDRLDGNRYAYARDNPVANRDRNGLFEEPVHGITTFRLAVAAGFTVDEAATIAVETAAMDHDHEHWPGGGKTFWEKLSYVSQILLGRTQRYHFPSQEKALADVDADIAGGVRDLTQFAQHLHSLEDVGFTDATGPHNRSNSRIFGDITGLGTVAFMAAGAFVGAATGLFSGTGGTGAAVATGILLGLGALMFVAFLFVSGVGHPTYTTEKHHLSTSFSHIADRASEDPQANSDELWEIYATLRRARAARYGSAVDGNKDAASAAITDVVEAKDSCAMSNMANLEVTDFRGNRMTYAQALARRTHDSWTPQDIDVSFTSGEKWTYRPSPAQQLCRPLPAR